MSDCPFRVNLFGQFEVLVNGRPIPRLRTRSVEWILALLTLNAGKELSRSWIAGTLWPDADEVGALMNLRRGLWNIRAAIGSESARIISPRTGTIQLDLTGGEADVLLFDHLAARSDVSSLERAVALYRGPLLVECAAEWAVRVREERQEAAIHVLESLSEERMRVGDYAAAIGWLRRAEAIDPLRDRTQRKIMEAQVASGDSTAAVVTYRQHRVRLDRELHLEPDPEMTQLYHVIREKARGKIRAGWDHSRKPDARTEAPVPSPPGFPSGRAASSHASRFVLDPPPLLHPLTEMIGRRADLAGVQQALQSSRLVTLVGFGGIGKTRLALDVARAAAGAFPDGAAFVELASVTDPAAVPAAVAAALGLSSPSEREISHIEVLADVLESRAFLLVLDNCEHLAAAAADLIHRLLQRCRDLRCVATSRESLKVPGELVWRVPALPVPDADQLPRDPDALMDMLHEHAATSLFLQRSGLDRPGSMLTRAEGKAVAEICRRLDGIPLAIELAAARAASLGIIEMYGRLKEGTQLLGGSSRTALHRHQTIQNLIDWSYSLLSPEDQTLLARLSIFLGGFGMEGAEAVGGKDCQGFDCLASLVEKSLVASYRKDGRRRYKLLETIREFARGVLEERGEVERTRDAHLEFYVHFTGSLENDLWGPQKRSALLALYAEQENLRLALEWADGRDSEAQRKLLVVLSRYWELKGPKGYDSIYIAPLLRVLSASSRQDAAVLLAASSLSRARYLFPEALSLAEKAAEQSRIEGSEILRARSLLLAGASAADLNDFSRAREEIESALVVYRALGDSEGTINALAALADVVGPRRNPHEDLALFDNCSRELSSLAAGLREPRTAAASLEVIAALACDVGDFREAARRLETCLDIYDEIGEQRLMVDVLLSLGRVATARGDHPGAEKWYAQGAAVCRRLEDDEPLAWALLALGNVISARHDYDRALEVYRECLSLFRMMGSRLGVACCLNNLGLLAYRRGAIGRSRSLHEEALLAYRSIDPLERYFWLSEGVARTLERLTVIASAEGRLRRAVVLGAAARRIRIADGSESAPQERAEYDAALKTAGASLEDRVFKQAEQTALVMGAADVLLVTLPSSEDAEITAYSEAGTVS